MITFYRACTKARRSTPTASQLLTVRRWLSQLALHRLAQPLQSYISRSRDPYLNLSIEHFLLQKSAPDSAILFLYINRPSIIIGRNQNPWLEVNLALLNPGRGGRPETEPSGLGAVDLVRRRSGGGTVFHDEGNVNWTVISPSASFTRDKHAEMVTRALRSCGVERARVNERHDIVLDQGQVRGEADPNDTHVTPYTRSDAPRPLKVSGSAYKLTRQRALHHGTALLSSPNLQIIPDYLHSPAKPCITARGVESVSSPVGNILLENEAFIKAVQREFHELYGGRTTEQISVDDNWLEDDGLRKGYDELRSLDWTFLQTPQFTISNKSDASAPVQLELTVRHGVPTSGCFRSGSDEHWTDIDFESDRARKLHEMAGANDFEQMLRSTANSMRTKDRRYLAQWLSKMLPNAR